MALAGPVVSILSLVVGGIVLAWNTAPYSFLWWLGLLTGVLGIGLNWNSITGTDSYADIQVAKAYFSHSRPGPKDSKKRLKSD
jgi:hypothetical protein